MTFLTTVVFSMCFDNHSIITHHTFNEMTRVNGITSQTYEVYCEV